MLACATLLLIASVILLLSALALRLGLAGYRSNAAPRAAANGDRAGEADSLVRRVHPLGPHPPQRLSWGVTLKAYVGMEPRISGASSTSAHGSVQGSLAKERVPC